MLNPNIKEKFWANWVAIVLSTITIIQGLAFNFLVANLETIINHTYNTQNFILFVHFLLSFALLLRIFQTYIIAALDYDDWQVGLFDILTIFVIGVFEYYLFASLTEKNFNIKIFHFRLSIITVLGLLGYLNAYFSIKPETYLIYHDYIRERKLQFLNILGILIVQINSAVILFTYNLSYGVIVITISISIFTIILNIFYSVKITFMPRAIKPKDSIKFEKAESFDSSNKVIFSYCSKRQVNNLSTLFFDNFGYVYISIFDTSPRLTEKILNYILKIRDGKHPLGFNSFIVASDVNKKEFYGFMLLNTRHDFNLILIFYVFFRASIKTLLTLGLFGLFRLLFNIRMVSNELWKCKSDEMQIIYLAIKNDLQAKGIGSKFITYAKDCAVKQNKKLLSLEVREKNINARKFFINHGFKEIAVLNNEFDILLHYGSRIIMQLEL